MQPQDFPFKIHETPQAITVAPEQSIQEPQRSKLLHFGTGRHHLGDFVEFLSNDRQCSTDLRTRYYNYARLLLERWVLKQYSLDLVWNQYLFAALLTVTSGLKYIVRRRDRLLNSTAKPVVLILLNGLWSDRSILLQMVDPLETRYETIWSDPQYFQSHFHECFVRLTWTQYDFRAYVAFNVSRNFRVAELDGRLNPESAAIEAILMKGEHSTENLWLKFQPSRSPAAAAFWIRSTLSDFPTEQARCLELIPGITITLDNDPLRL